MTRIIMTPDPVCTATPSVVVPLDDLSEVKTAVESLLQKLKEKHHADSTRHLVDLIPWKLSNQETYELLFLLGAKEIINFVFGKSTKDNVLKWLKNIDN